MVVVYFTVTAPVLPPRRRTISATLPEDSVVFAPERMYWSVPALVDLRRAIPAGAESPARVAKVPSGWPSGENLLTVCVVSLVTRRTPLASKVRPSGECSVPAATKSPLSVPSEANSRTLFVPRQETKRFSLASKASP